LNIPIYNLSELLLNPRSSKNLIVNLSGALAPRRLLKIRSRFFVDDR
jgi:hypothetical protein